MAYPAYHAAAGPTGWYQGLKDYIDAQVASVAGGGTDLGWYDVRAYGAVGDGSTDDSAAIQSAINALPTSGNIRGGALYFPKPSYYYKCNTALSLVGKPPIAFIGEPAPSYNASFATGSTLGTGTASMVLVNAVNTSATLQHEGHTFLNMNFRDFAGGSTLLSVKDLNRCTVRDCNFRDAATAVKFDGDTNVGDDSWCCFANVHMRNVGIGYDFYGYSNNEIAGGEITIASTAGIRCNGYVTQLRAHDMKINGALVGVDCKGFNNTFRDIQMEACTTGYAFDRDGGIGGDSGKYNAIHGGGITGAGAGYKGFTISATAAYTQVVCVASLNNGAGDYTDSSATSYIWLLGNARAGGGAGPS